MVHILAHIVQVVVLAPGPDALHPGTSERIAVQRQQQMPKLGFRCLALYLSERSLLATAVPHPAKGAQACVLGLCRDALPKRSCRRLAVTGAAHNAMTCPP